MNGELPAWDDRRLVRRILDHNGHGELHTGQVRDVYPDTVAEQLVIRVAGGRRLRFELAPAQALRLNLRRPALREGAAA